MPVFVHLTSHGNLPAIRRGGIDVRGMPVYAMPVTRNFAISPRFRSEIAGSHAENRITGVER